MRTLPRSLIIAYKTELKYMDNNNHTINDKEIERLINENIDAISSEYHISPEEHEKMYEIAHKITEAQLAMDGYTVVKDDQPGKKERFTLRDSFPYISWIIICGLLVVNFRAMNLCPLAAISLGLGILWIFRLIKRILGIDKK